MFLLNAPSRDHTADFDAACKNRRVSTKTILESVREEVLLMSAEYGEFGRFPWLKNPMVLTDDASNALRNNYSQTYEGRALTDLRAAIMSAAFSGLCAFCTETQASTLDHYLPKALYPELSILSANLLPVCHTCNHKKSNIIGSISEGRFIHPYFDDLSAIGPLIECVITRSANQLNVDFDIRTDLPSDIFKVALFHFNKLGLALRYSEASAVEILNHAGLFVEAHQDEGPSGVKREAARIEKSIRRKFDDLYWKVALYRAMQESNEFCDGGYELVDP